MSRFKKFIFVIFLLWALVAGLFTYGYYLKNNEAGVPFSNYEILLFIAVGILPLFILIVCYGFLVSQLANTSSQSEVNRRDLEKQFQEIKESQSTQKELLKVLLERNGPAFKMVKIDSDGNSLESGPALPLTDKSDENTKQITLRNIALALNFEDTQEEGDWKIAYDRLRPYSAIFSLLHLTDRVLTLFEEEGVFLENLVMEEPVADAWRIFSRGERTPLVKSLASIKDLTTHTLIRTRIRKDNEFYDTSLNFQKSFIYMLAEYAPNASTDELNILAQSRGGRAFAVLGDISRVFEAKD